MAITRNNQQSTYDAGNTTAYTLAGYAVPAGANRLLVVRVAAQKNTAATLEVTVAWGGVSLSSAAYDGAASGGNRYHYVGIFYLINPTPGTADIVVSIPASATTALIVAETLTGAAQAAPVGATASSRATLTSSLALTSCQAGSLILAATVSDSAGPPTWAWTTAVEDYDLNAGANVATDAAGSGAHYDVAGAGNVTLSATRSTTAAAMVAVAAEFLAAENGPAVAVLARHHRALMTA